MWLVNFTFAFFSFSAIIFATFLTQRRKIKRLLANTTDAERAALCDTFAPKFEKDYFDENEKDTACLNGDFKRDLAQGDLAPASASYAEQNTPKRRFFSAFSKVNLTTGSRAFFAPFRLFAYGFLFVGLLVLIRHELFAPVAFFSGLLAANIFVIIAAVFLAFARKTNS